MTCFLSFYMISLQPTALCHTDQMLDLLQVFLSLFSASHKMFNAFILCCADRRETCSKSKRVQDIIKKEAYFDCPLVPSLRVFKEGNVFLIT